MVLDEAPTVAEANIEAAVKKVPTMPPPPPPRFATPSAESDTNDTLEEKADVAENALLGELRSE